MKQIIDRKNLLLIFCVTIFFVVVGLILPYIQYQYREKQLQLIPIENQKKNGKVVNVDYTNKGFEPKIITITVGTSVIWANHSDKLMWVGSDPHPSHTDLPGFDQKEAGYRLIPQVEAHGSNESSYEYTFTKVGRWGYHNHLSPNDRGLVIVNKN